VTNGILSSVSSWVWFAIWASQCDSKLQSVASAPWTPHQNGIVPAKHWKAILREEIPWRSRPSFGAILLFFARAPFFRPTADKRNVPCPSIKRDSVPCFYEQGTNSNENIETGRSSVRVKEHNWYWDGCTLYNLVIAKPLRNVNHKKAV
jgi:hypothetical protein